MRRELLEIADRLRALATTGLHYTEGPFDRERYETLLELAARLAGVGDESADAEHLARLYRDADEGYVTPKVDVRAALFRGDRVLLVRERIDGLWALPGGYADIGESPSEAAERETAEEAGIEVRVERLAGIFDYRLQPEAPLHHFHIYKLVFSARALQPEAEPVAGSEATDAAFWPLAELPELSLGRTLPLHVREARRVHADPAALPHFD